MPISAKCSLVLSPPPLHKNQEGVWTNVQTLMLQRNAVSEFPTGVNKEGMLG